jgi:hypothetical protein
MIAAFNDVTAARSQAATSSSAQSETVDPTDLLEFASDDDDFDDIYSTTGTTGGDLETGEFSCILMSSPF